jgi:hypothetical protein
MVYGFRNGAAGSTEIHGINVASFNGAAYAFGVSAVVDTPYSGSNAYHPFNLIVDSAGTAHVLYVYVARQTAPRATCGTGRRRRPARCRRGARPILDAVPGSALSRSVPQHRQNGRPERLYAFAHKGGIRW